MFGRKPKFEPEGYYNGYEYRVVASGKIDVNLDGRITRFGSFEAMIARLDHAKALEPQTPVAVAQPPPIPQRPLARPPPLPPVLKQKKSGPGCGCLVLILIGFAIYFSIGNSDRSKIADIINSQFGMVCEAKVEGSETLRLDWTSRTTKLNVITVMAAIGKSKETLYSKGIRYLKYPNDGGTYNVIDWKTGERTSVNEPAHYYFRN